MPSPQPLHRSFAAWGLALTILCTTTAPVAAQRTFTEQTLPDAELRYIGPVPVAILTGTPEEMGRQHVDLLAADSDAAMDMPHRYAAEFGVDKLWPLIVSAGRTLILQAPERHQRELAAATARFGKAEQEIIVANTLLELRRVGCSTLIVEPSRSATGAPIFGRNFDFLTLGELHKQSIVFVYRPIGLHAFASVAFPGMIGVFSGMNDAGLALATLDVEQSADGSRKFESTGMPLAFAYRQILEECTTVDEAEALLRRIKPTTWMNLAVCDRAGGAIFEITPGHVARRNDEGGVVRCTNHFRTAGMTTGETCWRYDRLCELPAEGPLDLHSVHERLDAVNQGEDTLQTMVFEPRDLVLHLAIGEPPVSDDPLTRIELRPFFEPAGGRGGTASGK